MRTNEIVKTETNGTLKMNKRNMVTGLFTGFALMLVATVGMSFNTEDTTRASDTSVKMAITKAVANEKLELANYTPANTSTRKSDMVMDANFRINELKNRSMAAAFTKNVNKIAAAADELMTERMILNVMVPAFTIELNLEIKAADASIDVKLNEDAEIKAKTTAYKTGMNTELSAADNSMDMMINATSIKHIKPFIALEADKQMDAVLNGKNISPSLATEADSKMDALINKN